MKMGVTDNFSQRNRPKHRSSRGMMSCSGISRLPSTSGLLVVFLIQISFTSAAKPNPPEDLTAFEITPTSIKVSWRSTNVDDLSYTLQYKAKQDPKWREITGIKDTVFKIEKMHPFQMYEIQVIAVTKPARSYPSPTVEVVTGEIGAYFVVYIGLFSLVYGILSLLAYN